MAACSSFADASIGPSRLPGGPIEADPLEVWPRMNLHAYLQAAGQDREAYAQAKRVLELDENLVVARVSITHFHADWGELPEAVAAARKAYAVGPWYPDAVATLAALLRRLAKRTKRARCMNRWGPARRSVMLVRRPSIT